MGFLILEGTMMRTVGILDGAAVELLGKGDLLLTRSSGGEWASVPQAADLDVLEAGRIAVLDAEFHQRTLSTPSIAAQLLTRATQRTCSSMLQLALTRVRSLSARLLIVLWHLADRWGRWERGAIVVPLALTHEQLAMLISVRREAVTKTALPELIESGRVSRRPGGGFGLHGPAPQGIDRDEVEASLGSRVSAQEA